ncbi:putative IS5 family ISBce20-like transposase [Streptomyces avermitilis MA-4680 = NBRC 14893]|uniref:IS5 family ISBce20-like transposase n=1 Tax=Streptomyces avermitilis (strain ATCC 31267 / DSM 46492 / JCM 5070 / NBRC 14893 / NCIMB 12804 / NRRL 8165 / MA-4680) TaxID=227882 RepID=Q82Q39_STRAW|nr:putative IS5 family ISBce20-like transposase [Streptomyces avermitilis MA-4680 = NBRC 14893]
MYRWVAEGAIALLHWFRRLRIRWEIRDDIHHAFVTLGCAVICRRRLRTALCREEGRAIAPGGWPARCVRTRS